jgi:alpha-tubulin suppressor-like RCC1 family protein
MQSRTPFPGAALGPPVYRWHAGRRLAPLLAPALLAAALGCSEDAESPTAPESAAPALAAAAPLSFRQVSAGRNHTCGVTTNDRAYCWGDNTWGQLGDGAPGFDRFAPVRVLGGLRFRHVSAGFDHTCGVTTDDRAFCWGRNDFNQLGDATSASRPTPGAVASGGRRFRQVRAGGHTCALTLFDVAFCWGWNGSGQLGDGTTTQREVPVRVLGGLRWGQLNVGGSHTCGVTTEKRAYCWGGNAGPLGDGGQLGDGTTTNRLRPVTVSGGLLIRQIDAALGFHTCAVTTADRAYCWGIGENGQLGNGTITVQKTPIAVAGVRGYDHVSTGFRHSCGVSLAGRGFCWGWNGAGQLGIGMADSDQHPTPSLVGNGLPLGQVSAGYIHTCGLTTGGLAYCWGKNVHGQLGDGTSTDRPTPVAVAGAM